MTELFLRSVFAENLALIYFLGMCTFLAVSSRIETAIGLGVTVAVILIITVPANYLIQTLLLSPGAWSWAGHDDLDLGFLRFLAFIGLIAATVQILEMVLNRHFPRLHQALGIFLPLLAVHCAVMGASLFMVERRYGFGESVIYGLGSGIGWAVAVIAFSAIRERLRYSDMPAGLQGLGSSFIVAGIMAMGFSAFVGIRLP